MPAILRCFRIAGFLFSKEGCYITQNEVNAVFDEQVRLCADTLKRKTKEYTGDDPDRLGAFKAAATLQHTTPQSAWTSMAQAELEKKEKRQREGIEAKKLRGEWDDYGRPSVMKQETFDENFQSVVSGETTPTQLRKNLGMTHSTFYRYRKTFYEKYPELSNSAN